MSQKRNLLKRFALRIIIPVALVIASFLIAFYAILIPGYEMSIMDRKAELIRELTTSATSILEEYHQAQLSEILTEQEAKQEALRRLEHLRYGDQGKDYFWITDLHPVMMMHPYRKELNGKDLSGFTDPEGKRMFVEFTKAVTADQKGEGYVDYKWQWKDDTSRIVPKLSYVKLFKPWGWVVGTGIYIEDVGEEIRRLERGLIRIALVITLIAIALLALISIQSFRSEQKRLLAEEMTRRSEEKYRTLVEAATEGTLMIAGGEIAYSNKVLQDLSGYTEQEITALGLSGIFAESELPEIGELLKRPGTDHDLPLTLQTSFLKKSGEAVPAELTFSLLPFGSGFVNVIIIHPITRDKPMFRMHEELTAELQASVLLLSRSISELPGTQAETEMNCSVEEAAGKMNARAYDAVLIRSADRHPIGIVTDEDIRKRVVAQGVDPGQPVYRIMSAPLVTISHKAMLFEAIALMQERKISHLGITDDRGDVTGLTSIRELLQIHQFSLAFIKHEIETSQSVERLFRISHRVPELTTSLLASGAEPVHLLRLTGMVFEALVHRIIGLALEKAGPAPVPFTFLVMGSAGREEQTLATDQDNAIIFADVEPERLGEVNNYFLKLGTIVSDWLNEAGYRYCEGKIMASNPEWCLSLNQWKSKVSKWIVSAEPRDLLDINIFFDFRPVYGEPGLSAELNQHIRETLKHHPAFFIFLTGNIQKLKPPLSLFGNIQVKGSREQPETFDIKMAMLPLVDIARLYSLKEEIDERGTIPRYRRLHQLGVLSEPAFLDRTEAFRALLSIRFRHQVEQFTNRQPMNNLINPDAMSHLDQAMLKKVLAQVGEFIARTAQDFKGGIQG